MNASVRRADRLATPSPVFFQRLSEKLASKPDLDTLDEPLAHFIPRFDCFASWRLLVNGGSFVEQIESSLSGGLKQYVLKLYQLGFMPRFGNTVSINNFLLNFPSSSVTLLWIPKNSCTSVKMFLSGYEPVERRRPLRRHALHETCQAEFGVTAAQFCNDRILPIVCVLRNPYERIASCYLDKFASPVVKGRPFEGFVRGHIREARDKLGLSLLSSESITFRQFLDYIRSMQPFLYDAHWRPQADFLGSLESFVHFISVSSLSRLPDLLGKQSSIDSKNKSYGRAFNHENVSADSFADLYPEELAKVDITDYAVLFDHHALATAREIYEEDEALYGQTCVDG